MGEIESGIARSSAHCMTMGTASTMTAHRRGAGLTLPGASSIPAADAGHPRMARAAGRRIVEMVWEDLKPREILTRERSTTRSIVHMAIGGSTNAIIHVRRDGAARRRAAHARRLRRDLARECR